MGSELVITDYHKWKSPTLWWEKIPCTRLRFTQGIAANLVGGAWNMLILAGPPLPDTLKTAVGHKLGNETTTSMF